MLTIDTSTLDGTFSSLSDVENYWVYNGLDCCLTREVWDVTSKQLDDVSNATYRHAMEMQAPLLEMMLEGLPVNLQRRDEILRHYETQFNKLEEGWQRLCVEGLGLPPDRTKRKGRKPIAISIGSPKDVAYLFYEVLGIPEKKKRAKGATAASITTDRAALESFRNYYFAEPFVNFILAMRDCQKAIGFLRTRLDDDNKIRCSFNVAGTDTGRLSSSFSDMGTGTNLQNVSGRMKEIFWAEPGWMIVDIDLEQGDSRGVGAIAWNMFVESHGEAWAGSYLDACESGDLHTTVCRMAWTNKEWGEDPTKWKAVAEEPAYRDLSFRDLAKKLGHGSNYLGQPPTMAQHTKLPVGLIVDFQHNYFGAFECVKAWQNETIRLVQTERKLISPWGRRRYFWKDPKAQSTLNAAIAYSPQNTTGEFTNRGMLQLFLERNRRKLPIRFLLQVHDSLVLMVRQNAINEMVPLILELLRVELPLKKGRIFTIPHGVKVGWNYGAASATNPFGLAKWKGEEKRTPPPRGQSIDQLLNTAINRL